MAVKTLLDVRLQITIKEETGDLSVSFTPIDETKIESCKIAASFLAYLTASHSQGGWDEALAAIMSGAEDFKKREEERSRWPTY